jgi:hypothetical protein
VVVAGAMVLMIPGPILAAIEASGAA